MVWTSKVLGPIISSVAWSAPPEDAELFLRRPVSQPIETHVHRFGVFELDVIGHYSLRCSVVYLHGRPRLQVPYFCEGLPCGHGPPAVDIHCSNFCLASRCHDCPDDLGYVQDGYIVGGGSLLLLDIKKWPPALLLAFASLRYEALL